MLMTASVLMQMYCDYIRFDENNVVEKIGLNDIIMVHLNNN